MREQERAAMEAPKARKADAIPRRRIFMMGNGKTVQPKRTKRFCNTIVERCLEAKLAEYMPDRGDKPNQTFNIYSNGPEVREHYDFVLGFSACFDAIARGTIDLEEHPVKVALQAYSDVHNITNKTNKVTDIMKELGE